MRPAPGTPEAGLQRMDNSQTGHQKVLQRALHLMQPFAIQAGF
jgi:hypothetical protein